MNAPHGPVRRRMSAVNSEPDPTRSRRRCGAVRGPDGSVVFRVWAPYAGRVDLVFVRGDTRDAIPMGREERGYFSLVRSDVADGQRYAFRLDGGPIRPDPASLW